jgi:hypothetical protein
LEEMVEALADTPSDEAEEVLFKLAEEDPRFYLNYRWRATALRLGMPCSARRIVDLTAKGAFDDKSTDDWHLARELGALIGEYPDLRAYVYELLKDGPTTRGLLMLARAVAENPDVDGLLLLVRFENDLKRSFLGWRTIEGAVTELVPSDGWEGAYNVVPVPAAELRRKPSRVIPIWRPVSLGRSCSQSRMRRAHRVECHCADPRMSVIGMPPDVLERRQCEVQLSLMHQAFNGRSGREGNVVGPTPVGQEGAGFDIRK